MTAPNVLNVIRGKYRLVLTPSNLSAAYPYGGTEMGLAHTCEFEYGHKTYDERAEEWGGAPVRSFHVGVEARLRAILRGDDATAIGNTFPTYVAGASGAPTIVPDVNGTVRAGKEITGSIILLCPADSPATLPFILLYNGLPRPDAAARFAVSAKVEAGTAVAWEGAPDSTGKVYGKGLLEDLSL